MSCYPNCYDWIESSSKPCIKKHNIFFQMALRVAMKSDMSHRHGCLIVSKNKVVCYGYNRHMNFNAAYSIHAEIDALRKAQWIMGNDLSNCVMYLVRISPKTEGDWKCSKPCVACAQSIQRSRISKVFFSC